MTVLTDLPVELLALILEYLGGAELRRDNARLAKLTLCRKWFAAAHPVFMDSVPGLRAYGYNIKQLVQGAWSRTQGRPLMHKYLQQIRIRLLGHWWDEKQAQVQNALSLDELENDFGDLDEILDASESPFASGDVAALSTIAAWQTGPLRHSLNDLFSDLGHFKTLRSISFEATSEGDAVDGAHGDYIFERTICELVQNLPLSQSLSKLILDVNTAGAQSSGYSGQICRDLSSVLPRVEHVRLRLPRICEDIFKPPNIIRVEDIRCKTLLLKLHLPYFDSARGATIPRPCTSDASSNELSIKRTYLHEYMLKAAGQYIDTLAERGKKMERFMISYVQPFGINIHAIDCLSRHVKSIGAEFFLYEDDGTPCWFELKDDELMDCGSYVFEHLVM